ncbi:MAG: hypothetical protein UHE86_08165 [Acutalibacteraceae bacterium]|nr:hypothetical protein [Acutalibacteraceae bacterium]
MRTKTSRIVNIRYKVNGLRFDAAVDCDWQMHAYGFGKDTPKDETPIELYCFDHKEWDIRMMYHKERNDQQDTYIDGSVLHSLVDFQEILKETRKWIKEKGL